MKTSLSSKGQIVLPAEIREQDRLRPGQKFDLERLETGQYLLKKISSPGQPGLLEWLTGCPEKDWFEPLPSQSTADL
jgi:AbrB family looped-hinge helix DNA binding protein